MAVATEDPTGVSQQLLSNTIANVKLNGAQAVQPDGTWTETSDYWYFGTTGFSQMLSGLITATGTDQGLLEANSAWNMTGLFHMYGTGFVQKFNYGDCGPNKYTATANSLVLLADQYNSKPSLWGCDMSEMGLTKYIPIRQSLCIRSINETDLMSLSRWRCSGIILKLPVIGGITWRWITISHTRPMLGSPCGLLGLIRPACM